jgi:hypothetical protein
LFIFKVVAGSNIEMATPAMAISIGGDGDLREGPKHNTFHLKLEDFINEHENPNEDTITTHHVLKFHPGDKNQSTGLWAGAAACVCECVRGRALLVCVAVRNTARVFAPRGCGGGLG